MKILNEIANENDRKTIIFVETKRRADEITRTVNRRGFNAVSIHGDKSQSDRDQTLNAFRSGRMNIQILVATDVASRGLGTFCFVSVGLVDFYQSDFQMAEISRSMIPTKENVLLFCRIFSYVYKSGGWFLVINYNEAIFHVHQQCMLAFFVHKQPWFDSPWLVNVNVSF